NIKKIAYGSRSSSSRFFHQNSKKKKCFFSSSVFVQHKNSPFPKSGGDKTFFIVAKVRKDCQQHA
ncbi:unnamed protein product, partial [Tenebrio molitor]